MSQPENNSPEHYGAQIRGSVDALMTHYFSAHVADKLKIEGVKTNVADLSFQKTWHLVTEKYHKTLTGRHSGNNYSSLHECKQAVASACQKIEKGHHSGFVGALESFVAKSPARATWEQGRGLGRHDTTFQHIHTCSSCAGQGRNTCSGCNGQGRCRCGRCSGRGRLLCSTCHGSGQTGSGQHRTFCGGCSGSGTLNCSFCFGNGQSQCNSCGGRGNVSCSPCDATGYFTEHYSIEVQGKGGLQVSYSNSLEDWQEVYINDALRNRVAWASLSSACFLDASTIMRQEPAYPLAFDIQGTLPFCAAQIELMGQTSHGKFVGEPCHVYQLGELGDTVFKPLINELKNPEDMTSLQAALATKATDQLLGYRNETSGAEALVLRQASIIGQETVGALFTKYHQAKEYLKASRSSQSSKAWILKSAKCSLLVLLGIALVDAICGNHVKWEETGLHSIVLYGRELPNFFLDMGSYIWLNGSWWIKAFWFGLSLVTYLVILRYLLSSRKMTKMRFLFGLFMTHVMLLMLYFLFFPLAELLRVGAFGLPRFHMLAAGLIHSFIVLPEVILMGMLIAMLRLRLRNDAQLKDFATEVGSRPLLQDLGYRVIES